MTQRIPPLLLEAVMLCAVVFGPLAFGATELWSVTVLEVMLFALAALCAARGVSNWDHLVYKTLLPAVLVLLLIGIVQYLNPRPASAPAGFLPFTVDKAATGRALLLWSAYAALLFSVPQILASRASQRRFLWTVFLLGGAIAVIGLMQRGQGNTSYYGLRLIRNGNPFGPYTNYDHAASMLVLAAFAGAGLWLARLESLRRIEHPGRRIEIWTNMVLIAFFLAIIVYAIVFIRSRGAIHAMSLSATVVGAFALWRFAGNKTRLIGGLLLLAAVALYGGYMSRHMAMIGFEATLPMTPYRLALYANSLEIARDFPLFGTGLDTFMRTFPAYQDYKVFEGIFEHVHNDWVELLIQTGWTGFLAYVGAVLAAFYIAAKAWLMNPSVELRCLGGACLGAALSFSLHGFADFSFQTPANAVLFLTFLICAGSAARTDAGKAAA